MKTKCILIIIWTILLVFSLIACNQHETKETTPNPIIDSTSATGTTVLPPTIDFIPIMIDDYSEYLAFLSSTDLPESFVPYEAFSAIGEFSWFICLTDATEGDYSQCMYTLIDANGWKLTLYVDSRADRWFIHDTPLNSISSIPENNKDLRFQSDNKERRQREGDIICSFVNGKLSSIMWYSDANEFTLCNTNGNQLGNYPTAPEHDTFVSKMLVKSEVQNALNALPDSVYQKSAK